MYNTDQFITANNLYRLLCTKLVTTAELKEEYNSESLEMSKKILRLKCDKSDLYLNFYLSH